MTSLARHRTRGIEDGTMSDGPEYHRATLMDGGLIRTEQTWENLQPKRIKKSWNGTQSGHINEHPSTAFC